MSDLNEVLEKEEVTALGAVDYRKVLWRLPKAFVRKRINMSQNIIKSCLNFLTKKKGEWTFYNQNMITDSSFFC